MVDAHIRNLRYRGTILGNSENDYAHKKTAKVKLDLRCSNFMQE